jgi:hypothetical protein
MITQNTQILDYCSVTLDFHLYFSYFRGFVQGLDIRVQDFVRLFRIYRGESEL